MTKSLLLLGKQLGGLGKMAVKCVVGGGVVRSHNWVGLASGVRFLCLLLCNRSDKEIFPYYFSN